MYFASCLVEPGRPYYAKRDIDVIAGMLKNIQDKEIAMGNMQSYVLFDFSNKDYWITQKCKFNNQLVVSVNLISHPVTMHLA